ncbi:DUF3224 domain-containing protein [Devosia sp. 1566]|uniref:DUF3224 domain-containing protein n=1 Tax=Devosia sp. 1566 TaxID=2499144 RepID=UPI000FD83E56|nr:DUF3224 domain-containing protein [Devosia sp. 1566]
MKVSGTFTVSGFQQADLAVPDAVVTGLPVGVSTMEKLYIGEVSGRSTTIFTFAFDRVSGVGSYLAMESFEGALGDKRGSFNFLHSAATQGSDRANEFFAIVEGSGTGELAGITGTGGISIDAELHHIWFDYTFG